MYRLASILYLLIATTLAGNFIVICLTFGFGSSLVLSLATATGALLAAPLAWILTQELAR